MPMNTLYTLRYGSLSAGYGAEGFDNLHEARKAFWKMVDSLRFDHVHLTNDCTGEWMLAWSKGAE